MEGDCSVYAHSSLWMRPTGESSINAKMVYTKLALYSDYLQRESNFLACACAFAVLYACMIT